MVEGAVYVGYKLTVIAKHSHLQPFNLTGTSSKSEQALKCAHKRRGVMGGCPLVHRQLEHTQHKHTPLCLEPLQRGT